MKRGLIRHFEIAKTLDVLHEYFYSPINEKRCAKNM